MNSVFDTFSSVSRSNNASQQYSCDETNSVDNDCSPENMTPSSHFSSPLHFSATNSNKRKRGTSSHQPTKSRRAHKDLQVQTSQFNAGSRKTPASAPGISALGTSQNSHNGTQNGTPVPNSANMLFPDPYQCSAVLNMTDDAATDNFFSPMPPSSEQPIDWDNVTEFSPATGLSLIQKSASADMQQDFPSSIAADASVPPPSQSAVVPAAKLSNTTNHSPRKSLCIKSEQPQASAPPKKMTEQLPLVEDTSNVPSSKPQMKTPRKRTRSGSLKTEAESPAPEPKKADESLPPFDDESFIVDDEVEAHAPPKKKRRKSKKKKSSSSGGFNTGAWSDEEHEKFLEGLRKFGRSKWREISEFVGTRSRIQVASHSQKYFAKMEGTKMKTKKSKNKKTKKN